MLYPKKIVAIMALAAFVTLFANAQSSTGEDALHRLEGLRALPDDYDTAQKHLRDLFALRSGVEKDVAETLAKATAAGLVAIGDLSTYDNVKKYVTDVRVLEATFSDDCPKCKGVVQSKAAGSPTCPICKGTGRALKKSAARKQYSKYVERAIAIISTHAPDVVGNQSAKQEYGAIGGEVSSYWRSVAPNSLTDKDTLSHFLQGLSLNSSRGHKMFKAHEFNFDEYRKWTDQSATRIQRDKILKKLFSDGLDSYFYKDFIRCYFALVPDGLSFTVREVDVRTDWHPSGDPSVRGPDFYFVKLALLSDGDRYTTGSGSAQWTGSKWQSFDLKNFLVREALFPRSELCLLIPMENEEVESLKRGDIIVSKGWIYDILIRYGTARARDGSFQKVEDIHRAENMFRSIEERWELESGFQFE